MTRSTRSNAKRKPKAAKATNKDSTSSNKRAKPTTSTDASIPPTSKTYQFMQTPAADASVLKLVDKLLEEKGKGSVKMLVRYMTDATSDGCTGPVKELHLHSKAEVDQLVLMNSAVAGWCNAMLSTSAVLTGDCEAENVRDELVSTLKEFHANGSLDLCTLNHHPTGIVVAIAEQGCFEDDFDLAAYLRKMHGINPLAAAAKEAAETAEREKEAREQAAQDAAQKAALEEQRQLRAAKLASIRSLARKNEPIALSGDESSESDAEGASSSSSSSSAPSASGKNGKASGTDTDERPSKVSASATKSSVRAAYGRATASRPTTKIIPSKTTPPPTPASGARAPGAPSRPFPPQPPRAGTGNSSSGGRRAPEKPPGWKAQRQSPARNFHKALLMVRSVRAQLAAAKGDLERGNLPSASGALTALAARLAEWQRLYDATQPEHMARTFARGEPVLF